MILCFQKSNVFVGGGSADVADPCQFRHIQLLALVGGVVAKEVGGDVLSAHLRPLESTCKRQKNPAVINRNSGICF